MTASATITIQRSRQPRSRFAQGPGPAWTWYYETTGPDGTKFTNDSMVTLTQLLHRRYPGAAIVRGWEQAS